MTKSIDTVTDYLASQGLSVDPVTVLPSFVDPNQELNSSRNVSWSPLAAQTDDFRDLSNTSVESMSLASMTAVELLDLAPGQRVLDTCAAPGMKSLYAKLLEPSIELVACDLSFDRLKRLERLFAKHGLDVTAQKQDSTALHVQFEPDSFDRILIDAPCTGEGLILAGEIDQLEAWSPAKVKRLQQLQVKILKSAWRILKPGGVLVYSTCTINRNENERAVHKAVKIPLEIQESELQTDVLPQLQDQAAWRVLPSKNSIGFFIAKLRKPDSDSETL